GCSGAPPLEATSKYSPSYSTCMRAILRTLPVRWPRMVTITAGRPVSRRVLPSRPPVRSYSATCSRTHSDVLGSYSPWSAMARTLRRPPPQSSSVGSDRRRERGLWMDWVRFSWAPRCPWCWQTSRWARRLEELGRIELDWAPFSLEVVNLEEGADSYALDAHSGPALRSSLVVGEKF